MKEALLLAKEALALAEKATEGRHAAIVEAAKAWYWTPDLRHADAAPAIRALADAVRTAIDAAKDKEAPSSALVDTLRERHRQIAQWGGPEHDDEHEPYQWSTYLHKQLLRADALDSHFDTAAEQPTTRAEYRDRLIKIAALAIAATESLDRRAVGKGSK